MSKLTCIDRRPWAKANHYRWRYEDGYRVGGDDDAWFVEVICKYGLIYPKGGDTLLAYANRGVKRHIAKVAGAEHHQFDDDAEVFRFPVDRLNEVAAILKPKKRRTLDPQRARAISGLSTVHAQSTENDLELPPMPRLIPEPGSPFMTAVTSG